MASRKRSSGPTTSIIQSPNDPRAYRSIGLPNGLRAVLISTTDTEPTNAHKKARRDSEDGKPPPDIRHDVASICVVVKCGTYHDKPTVPGTAHFCEHLLLLGNKKYPDENEFYRFFRAFDSNALANARREETLFLVDVVDPVLEKGLDRIAHLFIGPLFRQDTIDREIWALEAEYWMRKVEEPVRWAEMTASIIGNEHPMGMFRWGNRKTLVERPGQPKIDLQAELRELFYTYYCPDQMTVCVSSARPLDDLEQLVRQSFGSIPCRMPRTRRRQPEVQLQEPPFQQNGFCRLYRILPLMRESLISFQWQMPSQRLHYKDKVIEYVTYVVGHQGEGGLFHQLFSRGWAYRLAAGTPTDSCGDTLFCSIFYLEIGLTEAGFANVVEINRFVHQFLHKMRKVGPQQWLWNELKEAAGAAFRFQEPIQSDILVGQVALAMQNLPPEHWLCHRSVFGEFNYERIHDFMQRLMPDKCHTGLMCYKFGSEVEKFDQEEPRAGTRFMVEDYPEEWRRGWVDDAELQDLFQLPGKNPYLVRDFGIPPSLEHQPMLFRQERNCRLWYSTVSGYNQPKCWIDIVMKCGSVDAIRTLVTNDLFRRAVSMLMHPFRSYAEAVDHFVSIWTSIRCQGFAETLPRLAENIIDILAEFKCTEQLLTAVRTMAAQDLFNLVRRNATFARDTMDAVIFERHKSAIEKLPILMSITKEEIDEYARMLKAESLEIFVKGNVSPERASELLHYASKKFHSTRNKPRASTVLRGGRKYGLPDSEAVEFWPRCSIMHIRLLSLNPAERCSHIANLYCCGDPTRQEQIMMHLLSALIAAECFVYLRTKWQLGYDPHLHVLSLKNFVGFVVSVSPLADRFTLTEVNEKIDDYVHLMLVRISDLDQEEFDLVKTRLETSDLRQKPPEEMDLFTKQWTHILSGKSSHEQPTDSVQTEDLGWLTFDAFKQWAVKALSGIRDMERYRKLSVQIVGYGRAALLDCEGGQKIWDEYNASPAGHLDFPPSDPTLLKRRFLQPAQPTADLYLHSLENIPKPCDLWT